ncbi:MAG TPA: helix-turn-helix domain-containing protein [Steroidobacteraceae bacterium]|jgi:excisionase family DNA binding protein|nr:helix-turn-helix domain-containing protein [Steroidobacteraceae bacterium]
MASDLFSVFDIATRLNLHVKTVRNYVRDGRLKATRIGKQYRISRADVEAFTGHPVPPSAREMAKRQRHIEVSGIAQIDAISPEAAAQLASALAAFVSGRTKPEDPLRIDSIYDRHTGHLKIILLGGANDTAAALRLITGVLDD